MLDSVRTQMLAAMRTAGVKHAELPVMHAGDAPAGNVRAIDREVESAAAESQGKFTTHDMTYLALQGMMRSVNDRYTVFMTPKEYAGLNQGLDGGDFGGTGIVIQVDDKTKYISVENVVPNGPADKAGVQQDDLITTIDGVSTKGMTLPMASGKLRGKEGTKVTLTLTRDAATVPPITITRAKIHQLSVYEKMLPGKIGYVALTVFGRDTGDELNAALDRLQSQGARALVLDLRDNGGGYLEAAVDVSSKFISSGTDRLGRVARLEHHDARRRQHGDPAAAARRARERIHRVGVGDHLGRDPRQRRGHDRGHEDVRQGRRADDHPAARRSAVKITTARYLTPRNRDINHLGITPDIVVTENKHPTFGTPSKDDQLTRAIQYLDDKLARYNQENGV